MQAFRPLVLILALSMVATFAAEGDGWTTIFDGKSLDGWKVNESPASFKLEDGTIVANGARAHLFYVGDPKPFKNFEFQAEVMTLPNSNSGIIFHCKWQDNNWIKTGFEAQINNSYVKDPRVTASVYAVKDVKEAPAKDNEWFTYHIKVEGKTVVITINGKEINRYTEPDGTKPGKDFERIFGEGTFCLQAHDPGSTVKFKNIKVKRLPD
jgi:hypothetical protein